MSRHAPAVMPTPEQIARQYGGLVSGICARMIQNSETAADASQEVWVEILKSLHSFEGRSALSTWIYAITKRVVMRHAQRERVYSTRFLNSFLPANRLQRPL
jgi:RNA polymerase sigma-70 factor (ECF subfamily)